MGGEANEEGGTIRLSLKQDLIVKTRGTQSDYTVNFMGGSHYGNECGGSGEASESLPTFLAFNRQIGKHGDGWSKDYQYAGSAVSGEG
jgi:hypothetical protein